MLGVSCSNEVVLGGLLNKFKVGASHQKEQVLESKKFGTFSPTHHPLKKVAGWRLSPIKTLEQVDLGSFQTGEHISLSGGWCSPTRRGQRLLHFSTFSSDCSFVCFVIYCNSEHGFFQIYLTYSSKLLKLGGKEELVETLEFVAKLDRKAGILGI